MPYRVTKEYRNATGMHVATDSEFSRAIHALFLARKPHKIIETGTFLGLGTTRIILSAIDQAKIEGSLIEYYSIECNPNHFNTARQNCQGQPVELLHGLSLPRALLPDLERIENDLAANESDLIWVDGYPHERSLDYYKETNWPAPDDLLGEVLKRFNYRPDFVLLDSAGHLGFAEFSYVIDKLQGPCVIALDDIQHVKHYKSFAKMKADPRFKILYESSEKFGFGIADFAPR